MADLSKTVEIIFGGKNQVSGVIGDIEKSFGSLDSAVGKVADPLAKVADSVMKVDAALAAMAIGGLAYSVKSAGEFNGKFGEITTLIKDTGAPIDAFKKSILDYSTTSVKSIDQINEAIYRAISAGIKYQDALTFVSSTEKLAVAGRADLGETTQVLASILNAYGESTKSATAYSDLLFETVRIGQLRLEDLNASLGQVTSLAASAGIPFATVTAGIAAMTASGIPAEKAVTGLRQAIAEIVKPSAEAEKMAAQLGIQFNATAIKTRGFDGVLQDVWKATGGSVEKITQLFGSVRALPAVLTLAADKSGKFKEALDAMAKSAGATAVAYGKVAEEFENVNQRIANSFKVTLIEVGEKLLPKYGEIAGSFGDLMKGIRVGVDSGAFDPLFKYLDEVGAALSEWLAAVAKAFPDALKQINYEGLIKALRDLGKALGGMFGDLDLTKADDLAGVLQTLVDIITGFIRITTGMVEAFKPFANQIAEFFKTLAAGDEKTEKAVGNILLFSKAIKEAGLGVVAAIMAIDEYKLSIGGLFDILAGGVQFTWKHLEILVDGVKSFMLTIEALFVGIVDNLTFGLLPGIDKWTETINKQREDVAKSLKQESESAYAGFARLTDGLVKLGTETGNTTNKVKDLKAGIAALPDKKTISIEAQVSEENKKKMDELHKMIAALPDEKTMSIKTEADGTSIEKAWGMIITRFPDGSTRIVQEKIGVTGVDEAAKKIDDATKGKTIEIQAKLDEAKLKAQSDVIQSAMEWTAKVNIAQAETALKSLEAITTSISNTITSTGTLLGELTASYSKASSGSSVIYDQIQAESRRRDDALKLQKDLTYAEIDNINARTELLRKGEALIKVEAKGLQPQLEAFMWKILESIQVRATSEGANFLLGMTTGTGGT